MDGKNTIFWYDAWLFDIPLCVKYPNVFVAGELLNIDGMCGGYNLQFAWSSAGLIANSIKERIIKE